MKKSSKRYYLLAASECIFMKHTTVCGKSADRPIGGPCPPKARPRTVIETETTCSPPPLAVDWLFQVSVHEKAEKEIGPAHAYMRLVRVPGASRIHYGSAVFHWLRGFYEHANHQNFLVQAVNQPTMGCDWSVITG